MPVWFQDHVGKQHASQELQEANAARLVLAWNCHQDLIDALQGLLHLQTRYTNVGLKEFDAARAALAKVGGGQ